MPVLQPSQLDRIDSWLRSVLWEHEVPHATDLATPPEIHRLKGRLVFANGKIKMVQGVREIFEILDSEETVSSTPSPGKIVVIGRHVRDVDFGRSLARLLDSEAS